MYLLRHLRKNEGLLFDHFWIAIQWIQTFVGTSKNFLETTDTPLPHLLDGWFQVTRQFLQESDCTIEIDDAPTILPRRENDKNIMDDVCQSTTSQTDIEQINWCRLYLQVEYLSDISNLEGTHLQSSTIYSKTNPDPKTTSQPTKMFPNQGKPGPRQWKK